MGKTSEYKFKPILGALPEDTQWWTEKDWAEHNAYVEKLKLEGRYMTEGEEITVLYNKDDFKAFESDLVFKEVPPESMYFIPDGKGEKATINIQYKPK